MLIDMFEIVMIASSPRAQDIEPLGSYDRCLCRISGGKIFGWTSSWDYHSVKDLMQYGEWWIGSQ